MNGADRSWRAALDTDPVPWLLASDEPWTRTRTLLDLLDLAETDSQVQAARQDMLAHPQVGTLVQATAAWGERLLKRHNDASHPIYALSTLADFGINSRDALRDSGSGLRAGVRGRAGPPVDGGIIP